MLFAFGKNQTEMPRRFTAQGIDNQTISFIIGSQIRKRFGVLQAVLLHKIVSQLKLGFHYHQLRRKRAGLATANYMKHRPPCRHNHGG